MWAEYCVTYNDKSISFLEAIDFMKQGDICKDINGHEYKIKQNKIYRKLSHNNWVECLNYTIPTSSN